MTYGSAPVSVPGIPSSALVSIPDLVLGTVTIGAIAISTAEAFGLARIAFGSQPLWINTRTLQPIWLDIKTLQPFWISERTFNMIPVKHDLEDLVVGDTWAFRRTYKGLPDGAIVDKVRMTIKRDKSLPDSDPSVVQVEIDTSLSQYGQIEDANTENDGQITIYLVVPGEDQSPIVPDKRYHYDIAAQVTTGGEQTCELGYLRPIAGVTDSFD